MEWVETTGRTIEEARDAALDMLGVDESDAEFVTVTEPRPGLFGRLRGEARVRARVLPTTPPPKRGRSRRPPQRRDSGEGRKTKPEAPKAESSKSAPPKAAHTDEDADQDELVSETGSQESSSGGGQSRSARRRRNRSARSAGDSVSTNGAGSVDSGARRARSSTPKKSPEEEDTVTDTLSLEDQGALAKQFIEGLVSVLGMQATVTVTAVEEDDIVQVAVEGDELGVLVGQGGATLAAIQELARTVVQRKAGGHIERILVDVAGYRAKRTEALARFTRKVVDDVISTGKDKALEPMSPADRKVVHDTVNELGGAVTRSEGVEPRRYVVISPSASSDGDLDASSAGEAQEDKADSGDADTDGAG
jgi:spoIIIJ-associated protein